MSKTFGSLFTGGGFADVGAMQAGYTPLWGVEYDQAIAAAARVNLPHVLTANILDCNPRDFALVDLLHASPPCPNFSVANPGRGETAADIALAEKVTEFIRVLRPRAFTLENVAAYRHSRSLETIRAALDDAGYMSNAALMLASDYGVPQSRRRYILRAVRGGLLRQVQPAPGGGWYAAIADLIDTFPDDKLAPWQAKRLDTDILPLLVERQPHNASGAKIYRSGEQAAQTITAQDRPDKLRVLVDCKNASHNGSLCVAIEQSQSMTISASSTSALPRIVDDTLHVKRLTPRAIARLQTLPDWYTLPAKTSLAIKIIGNALPCELYRRIAESVADVS